jgi:hypothetical protein
MGCNIFDNLNTVYDMKSQHEYQTCVALATYLKYQYPSVLFRFDMAGLNLSKAQAGQNKQIQCLRGYPDLFILEPKKLPDGRYVPGIFIEIKKEGEILKRKNGNWASEHLQEQWETMQRLEKKGYLCAFAVGFQEARDLIDQYLG